MRPQCLLVSKFSRYLSIYFTPPQECSAQLSTPLFLTWFLLWFPEHYKFFGVSIPLPISESSWWSSSTDVYSQRSENWTMTSTHVELPGTESALAINTGKTGWEVALKLLSDISRQAVQTEILLRECKPTRGTCQHPSFFQGSPLGLQGSKRKCYLSTLPSSWGRKKAENSGSLGHIVKYQRRSCIEEGMNPWLPRTMKATWVTSLGRQRMAVRILRSK